MPLRFGGLYPGQSHKLEEEKLNSGIDCVVATFERMQLRRDKQKLFLSNVNSLVIDEFDTMVDSGLEDRIRQLLDQYLDKGPKQVVFASATVSKHMSKIVEDYFGKGTDPSLRFKEIIEKSTHMNL